MSAVIEGGEYINFDIISLVQHYGYFALFFALWLGIVGIPIPDEVIVMTGGLVTAFGLLSPIPAFILTYLGVVSGLSLGYFLGRLLGTPILDLLVQKKKTTSYLPKAQKMFLKYAHYALVFSYFFPVVRHLVPYIAGISKMSYRKYAVFSYSTGFFWTLIYFVIGRQFGNHIDQISAAVNSYGWDLLITLLIISAVLWFYKYTNKTQSNQELPPNA